MSVSGRREFPNKWIETKNGGCGNYMPKLLIGGLSRAKIYVLVEVVKILRLFLERRKFRYYYIKIALVHGTVLVLMN